jgi:hypothetical protein
MSGSGRDREALLTPSPTTSPTVTRPSRPLHAAPAPDRNLGGPAAAAVVVAATGAVVYGALLRVWLLVHLPLWGDEAVTGLQARAIDSGHFTAFYWGQHYGGLEPYVAAIVLKVGGGGEPALNATPALLSALAAVLVGGITLAAGKDRLLALAAGALAWVWPYVVIYQSVREVGFRYATLCCGLTAVLCSIRVYQRRAGRLTFVLLGVALGLGWWASAEIVYFAMPSLVLLVGWWTASRPSSRSGAPGRDGESHRWGLFGLLGLVACGAVLGSLPWWYANAHTGFASLRRGALPANGGVTYGAKLSVFFHDMLPMQLGLRNVLSGAWVGGPVVGRTLYTAALALVIAAVVRAVWLSLRDAGRLVPVALAAGVVCFPFLYAAAPGTGYWFDGRYGIYLPALLAALFGTVLSPPRSLAVAGSRGAVRRGARTAAWTLAALGIVGAGCLTVAGAHTAGVPASPAFFSGWHSGDAPMQQVVDAMRARHITDAYGDYWTAYDLDFLSRGEPLVSPSVLDVDRSTSIAAGVASSADPAWLFFAPGETTQAATEFLNPQPGPGPYTEQTFEERLNQLGISYRVVKLGILDAVIPSRRLIVP